MLNIGILGSGKMGRVHAEAFSKNENCKIVGFYNRTKEKALDLQKNHPQAKVYDSWQEMIEDKSIDVITISTPQVERLEQYKLAIKHGKDVFLEKPMGLGLDDLKEVLVELKRSDSCFYVDSQIRSNPTIEAINKEIHRIGKIFHIDMEFSMYRDEIKWKHKLLAGGGVLRELCGHMIDQAEDWLGKAKSVTANNKIVLEGREVEDFSVSLIEYENGASLLVSGNYFEQRGNIYEGRILGEKGQITFTFSSYKVSDAIVDLYINGEKISVKIDIPDENDINSIYPGHMDSFKKEISLFVEAVLNNKKADDTIIKEWNTQQIISASYESTRTNQKVFLPLEGFDIDNLPDSFIKFYETSDS